MRVLIPLSGAGYGNEPFFYLVEHLRDQFSFVITTPDAELIAQCEALGIDALQYDSMPALLPGWMRRLQQNKVFWPMTNSLEEYRRQRHWAQQAHIVIEKTQPDVILVGGDYDYLDYYLCGRGILTVLPQITAGWASVEEILNVFPESKGYRQFAIGLLRMISALMRRPLLYKIGGQRKLPHGLDLGRTIGGSLGGMRYTTNQKGANADILCVNGPAPGKVLFEAGATHARQVVTGSPLDDKLFHIAREFSADDEQSLRDQLNIPAESCIIAFFLQNFHERMLGGHDYYAEVTRIMHDLVEIDERVVMMVKPHPRHDKAMFSAQNNNPRLIVTDEAGEDFNNRLILSSRLVITRTSTVGYNALALGVPLLSYALYDLLIEKHFATVGGAAIATSYADIVTQARRLLFDEDARTQLQQEQIAVRSQHMVLDGLCRERIGEVIRQAAI